MRDDSKRRVFVLLQMKSEVVSLVILAFLRTAVGNLSYELSTFQESHGVYFEDQGHATLSSNAWTILLYVLHI